MAKAEGRRTTKTRPSVALPPQPKRKLRKRTQRKAPAKQPRAPPTPRVPLLSPFQAPKDISDGQIAHFLVFAKDYDLLMALIGENGAYMRDLAARYRLSHLELQADDEDARARGVELGGRFAYVMVGEETKVSGAVHEVAKLIYAISGYRIDTDLDPLCMLDSFDRADVSTSILSVFKTLSISYVTAGSQPLSSFAGPSTPPKTVEPQATSATQTSASRASTVAPSEQKASAPAPVRLLDVSNAYFYPLPHRTVCRLLLQDGGVTIAELVAHAQLSDARVFDDPPTALLTGSVNAIRQAIDTIRTIVRVQTCFTAATFDSRLVRRVDPLDEEISKSADSSSESTRSSRDQRASSATTVSATSQKGQ